MPIVTRFAPSPTGFLHIGGLRTALFSYLFARQKNGKFLLRVEDTDQARNSEEAAKAILEAFSWVGLDYDGEAIFQSKRFDIYEKYAQKLLDAGKAYCCYMSKEELDALRSEQEAKGLRPKYDNRWRDSTVAAPEGVKPVIRIKAPLDELIEFDDGVKGPVSFKSEDILDDFVILRADKTPTYNFTVVVDDHLMGVSDVIRGDDHLSNTPKQIIIYKALEAKIPRFYHLAMINGEDGKKLSKRHGATDVMEYKRLGFLPEALLNFLLRLGFAHKDEEIFSMQDMLRLFSFNNVSKGASAYNYKKLLWLNAHYIKSLPDRRLNEACIVLGFNPLAALNNDAERLNALFCMLRERAKDVLELIKAAKEIINKPAKQGPNELLDEFSKAIKEEHFESEESIKAFLDDFLKNQNIDLKTLAKPLRIALTGSSVTPSIYALLHFLGYKEVQERVKQ